EPRWTEAAAYRRQTDKREGDQHEPDDQLARHPLGDPHARLPCPASAASAAAGSEWTGPRQPQVGSTAPHVPWASPRARPPGRYCTATVPPRRFIHIAQCATPCYQGASALRVARGGC